jgi:hypothetical protein
MPYSEKLKQSYTVNPDKTVTFSDGVNYKMSEMSLISGIEDSTMIVAHKIKETFLGEVISL